MKKITATGFFAVIFFLLAGKRTCAQDIVDKNATAETRNLFKNLMRLSRQHILFGHQDALAYGVGWKNITGMSDVRSVTGEHPAVYGWDLGHLELDSSRNLDGIPFAKMKQYMKEGYQRGGVITISWHLRNPVNGKSAWDTTPGSVAAIIPGGHKHELFKTWLNKVAAFIKDLKGTKGEPIPVLFRPYHELTGNWFWWCRNVSTADEFKKLWRFTVDYLKKEKGVHQLLYVFNTADFTTTDNFLERYPGDDYADVISFDLYQHGPKDKDHFRTEVRRRLLLLQKLGEEKGKLTAFAETGYEAIPDAGWWTETLLPAIAHTGISYVLAWRNHGYMPWNKKMHYYVPYSGQVSAADFIKFCRQPQVMLEKKIKAENIYR